MIRYAFLIDDCVVATYDSLEAAEAVLDKTLDLQTETGTEDCFDVDIREV